VLVPLSWVKTRARQHSGLPKIHREDGASFRDSGGGLLLSFAKCGYDLGSGLRCGVEYHKRGRNGHLTTDGYGVVAVSSDFRIVAVVVSPV
jgi:hypothetical protein